MLEKTITLEPGEEIIIKADESFVSLIDYLGRFRYYQVISLNEREVRDVRDFLSDWLKRH